MKTRVSLLKSPYGGADTEGGRPVLPPAQGASPSAVPIAPDPASSPSALVCASLYAALLGAGAFAQDEDTTPAPAETAAPAQTEVPRRSAAPRRPSSRSPPLPLARRDRRRGDARSPRRPPRRRSPTRPRSRPRTPPRRRPRRRPLRPGSRSRPRPRRPASRRRRPRRSSASTRSSAHARTTSTRTASRASRREVPPQRQARRHGRHGLDLDSRLCRGRRVTTVRRVTATATSRSAAPTPRPPPTRRAASPTPANPGYSLATPGPAPIGVPNFFIEKFRIPPFLLPIYQAAGIQYGIRWEVLAAINEIETDYGRNLNISSAGALGLDAVHALDLGHVRRRRQRRRPEGPVQPGRRDLRRRALPARRGRRQGPLPRDLRLQPRRLVRRVRAHAGARDRRPADRPRRLADGPDAGPLPGRRQVDLRRASSPTPRRGKRFEPGQNAAHVVESDGTRRDIRIFSRQGAPVVAVNDGRITRLGHSRRLGNFVELQDTYGNTYLYSGLGQIAKTYPVPARAQGAPRRPRAARERAGAEGPGLALDEVRGRKRHGEKPRAGKKAHGKKAHGKKAHAEARPAAPVKERISAAKPKADLPEAAPAKERLFAHPARPTVRRVMRTIESAAAPSPGLSRRDRSRMDGQRLDPRDFVAKPLKRGARVTGGTVLGQHRPHERRARPEPPLRDPPRRPRRPADRPEADPRRLEAARVDRDLPLGQAQPVLRRRRRGAHDRPDHADEQGGAAAPRAPQPEHRRLRLRPPGRRDRPDRPPRAGDARVPRLLGPEADGHLTALRPRRLHDVGQRVRAQHRLPRSTSARSTASSSAPGPRARARSPTSRSSACSPSRAR